MKSAIERAIRELLEAWEKPNSPEDLPCAIYELKKLYMAEVIADLNRKKPQRRKP